MKHILQDRTCLHNVEDLVDFYRNLRTISVLQDETHHWGYYGPLWYVFCDGISRGRFDRPCSYIYLSIYYLRCAMLLCLFQEAFFSMFKLIAHGVMNKMANAPLCRLACKLDILHLSIYYLIKLNRYLRAFLPNFVARCAMLLCLFQEFFFMFKLTHGVMNKMANTIVSSVH